jgi:hypothetical protein
MSLERLRLRLPDKCHACGMNVSVRLSSTVHGSSVDLAWWCGACGYEWPVRSADCELTERRHGKADRRKSTRADRRGRERDPG